MIKLAVGMVVGVAAGAALAVAAQSDFDTNTMKRNVHKCVKRTRKHLNRMGIM